MEDGRDASLHFSAWRDNVRTVPPLCMIHGHARNCITLLHSLQILRAYTICIVTITQINRVNNKTSTAIFPTRVKCSSVEAICQMLKRAMDSGTKHSRLKTFRACYSHVCRAEHHRAMFVFVQLNATYAMKAAPVEPLITSVCPSKAVITLLLSIS